MKKLICVILALVALFVFASCGKTEKSNEKTAGKKVTANVCVLTGPTGVGAVNMWNESESTDGEIIYSFGAAAAPEEIVAKISNGEADIAAVSTNLAAKLYMKTEGAVKVLAVNTYGVLSVLDNTGASVESLSDIRGRKIVTFGQGANPEYIIRYLLTSSGMDPDKDVEIEYKAEGADLVPVWATEPDAVIIAPAPVSTSILAKYEGSSKVLDLTDEWEKANPDSALMMGCIIARTEFIENHPEAISDFLDRYEKSISAALDNPQETGALCEKYGIVAKAAIAEKGMNDFHLCFVTGEEMKKELSGYLKVLFDADKTSVGALPDDGFWYEG